eukprot:SAG11_NODE_16979_length_532_cov_0.831409_1_plen_117_part_10
MITPPAARAHPLASRSPLLRLHVPLDQNQNNCRGQPREATIYVKGFMSSGAISFPFISVVRPCLRRAECAECAECFFCGPGETEDDFSDWAASHARLYHAHAWQPDGAYGYRWDSHG